MIDLPDAESETAVADWIELNLAVFNESIAKADIAPIIEALGGDSSYVFLSSVWIELKNRISKYVVPPFNVHERRVTRATDMRNSYDYIVCLIFSLYGVDGNQIGTKIFERLSALAVKEFLQGEAFIFGWPVITGGQTQIALRVQAACNKLLEHFNEAPRSAYKDRGVDVIAWKPFLDGRSCQCVLLGQCAAGKHWRSKTTELPYSSWTQYIHWACDPLRAFFVPCIVPDNLWHDVSREAGILFDRARIVNLLSDGISDGQLISDLKNWAVEQLDMVR